MGDFPEAAAKKGRWQILPGATDAKSGIGGTPGHRKRRKGKRGEERGKEEEGARGADAVTALGIAVFVFHTKSCLPIHGESPVVVIAAFAAKNVSCLGCWGKRNGQRGGFGKWFPRPWKVGVRSRGRAAKTVEKKFRRTHARFWKGRFPRSLVPRQSSVPIAVWLK